jgi:hypothetical protein
VFILSPRQGVPGFSVSFLDDDFDPASEGPGSRPSGAERQRQLLVRRIIALVIGVLVIILLLLAVRGCLNARKERGFENYVSDLDSIVTQSQQLSTGFFERLLNPPEGLNEVTLEAEIASDRGTADGLLDRIESLDTPDELQGAQQELVQSFELRRDALAGIAEAIPAALGDEERSEAVDEIVDDMSVFLASDVLFARARADILDVLGEQGIEGNVGQSQFLPEPTSQWLDDSEFVLTLTNFANESGNAPAGDHGLEMLEVEIDRTILAADFDNTVSAGGEAPEIRATIANGGNRPERGVTVEYTLGGAAAPIEGSVDVNEIDAGGTETVAFPPLEQVPQTGTPLTLEVEVQPVLGETLVDNNSLTYTVIFE